MINFSTSSYGTYMPSGSTSWWRVSYDYGSGVSGACGGLCRGAGFATLGDTFTNSATASNWSNIGGSSDTFDVNTSHAGMLTITGIAADTISGYMESEARTVLLLGNSPVDPSMVNANLVFPTGATSGEAGFVFGYHLSHGFRGRYLCTRSP